MDPRQSDFASSLVSHPGQISSPSRLPSIAALKNADFQEQASTGVLGCNKINSKPSQRVGCIRIPYSCQLPVVYVGSFVVAGRLWLHSQPQGTRGVCISPVDAPRPAAPWAAYEAGNRELWSQPCRCRNKAEQHAAAGLTCSGQCHCPGRRLLTLPFDVARNSWYQITDVCRC